MASETPSQADGASAAGGGAQPTKIQLAYLKRGLGQPGGKLPLFDGEGRAISPQTVRACITHGWAEPWFANPLKRDWLVCRLTENGRKLFTGQK
ncbi:MAG: hypothetical protein C0605_01120 [Hyphomicrobiales bacterium]|nr:MAG: hypothetical protein C0605_01120 [Hyphomicrobiales bacterium]